MIGEKPVYRRRFEAPATVWYLPGAMVRVWPRKDPIWSDSDYREAVVVRQNDYLLTVTFIGDIETTEININMVKVEGYPSGVPSFRNRELTLA